MAELRIGEMEFEGTTEEVIDFMRAFNEMGALEEEEIGSAPCEDVEETVRSKYVTEKREAKVGESILLTNPWSKHRKGQVFIVTDDKKSVSVVEGSKENFLESEYEVIVNSNEIINDGDVVVILGERHFESEGCVNEVGDIGVAKGRGCTLEGSVAVYVEGNEEYANYTHESELRLATDEEKTWLREKTQYGKDRNGDKVRLGDIIKCLRTNEIGVVTVADGTLHPRVQLSKKLLWACDGVKLIARAEERLDTRKE